MSSLHLAQVAAALVAAGTPWCVVRVALYVASRHAESVRSAFPMPPSVARLGRWTLWSLPLVAAPALWLTPPSLLMGAIDVAWFVGLSVLGLAALSDIDEASRSARDVATTVRTASLRPRALSQHVGWMRRWLPAAAAAVGLSTFGWRLASPGGDRRVWIPLAFVCFTGVFLWLYETWMRDEISGGRSADVANDDLRYGRRLRMILTVELMMVVGCLGVAHALLDLNWSVNGGWGAAIALAGASVGIVGCALAVSSELARRRYLPAPLEPRT